MPAEVERLGCGMNRATLANVFARVHEGFSADRVIADPKTNKMFVAECAKCGLTASAPELNRALLNLRKSGGFLAKTTRETSFDDEDYRFASEIAIRILERRDGVTLDDVLCDPHRATEFDSIAASLAPGYTPLEYRWAALALRKERSLSPEIVSRVLRPDEVHLVRLCELNLDSIPRLPGIYVFLDTSSRQALYVGEASNLRQRLGKHVEHSDNKMLARHLWDNGIENVQLEYYVLPEGISKRELRALELEQIQRRHPPFNISGKE
jgi:hypothetical protein